MPRRFSFFAARTAALFSAVATMLAPLHAQEWRPDPTQGWRPMPINTLLVKEGSALDFSALVEPGPAGKHGFLQIDAKGDLVFEKQPGKPLRFFCNSHPMEYWRADSPEEIAEFAKQVRLGGYNCYRAHYLDLMLMIETTKDLAPNPKQFERWDRLCAELKKQGVYLYVDISSIWFAYYASPVRGKAWTADGKAANLYGRMYWDPKAREHWAAAAKLLLEHVNPYTGLALKDDPQVITFVLRNEAGLHFLLTHLNSKHEQEVGLIDPFRAWLQKRYTSINALNKSWAPTTPYTTFDQIAFPAREGAPPPTADLQRFLIDTELELLGWMQDVMKQIGVRVPIQDYNVGASFAHNLSRSALPMVETHSYHDHPSAYVNPGSTMPNQDAVAQGLPFLAWANEVRQLDRPFIVTEWGYPYWNQYRYEAGLTAPAYGAFQGWNLLNQSHEPIALVTQTAMRPFKITCDPPNKAAERMAALFYARGDVSPSTHTVEVDLDPTGIFDRWGGEGYMPASVRRLPLLTRMGIRIVDFPAALPGAPVKADATLRISPTQRALVWTDDPKSMETPDPAAMVATLRQRGILSASNRTNIAEGIFQSDTGELTLDSKQRVLTVNTPRSQAVSLPAGVAPISLRDIDVNNRGEAGCFFVGSLDSQPLPKSRRLLVIAVGDAVNTGTIFTGPDRKTLKEIGTLPVLVKPVIADITLRRPLPEKAAAQLWTLAFNGDRVRELPVERAAGKLILHLDTSKDPEPVFQYELLIH